MAGAHRGIADFQRQDRGRRIEGRQAPTNARATCALVAGKRFGLVLQRSRHVLDKRSNRAGDDQRHQFFGRVVAAGFVARLVVGVDLDRAFSRGAQPEFRMRS